MRVAIVLLSVAILAAIGGGLYFFFLPGPGSSPEGDQSFITDFFSGGRDPIEGREGDAGEVETPVPVGPATTTYQIAEGKSVVLVSNTHEPSAFTKHEAEGGGPTGGDVLDVAHTVTIAQAYEEDGSLRFESYYQADLDVFIIVLAKEPLRDVRLEAEQAFLRALGFTQTQACALYLIVDIPGYVNGFYAKKNAGLSFCPGAIVL